MSWLGYSLMSLGILGCREKCYPPIYTVSRSLSGQPIFCFDEHTWGSRDESVFPLEVTNVGAKHTERTVWKIKCLSKPRFRLKSLEYGRVPDGWAEISPAKQIVPGNYYTINNGDFFDETETGTYEHLSPDQYKFRAQHHQLYKDPYGGFKFH